MLDAWDPLHSPSAPDLHWSTDNVGEACPGVLTPLTWSLWGGLGEKTTRNAFRVIGVLSEDEARVPTAADDRIIRVFYGRIAIQVEIMTLVGDRLPGTSGQEVAGSMLGKVPEDIVYSPTMKRYPSIAWRLPRVFFGFPRQLRATTPGIEAWWRARVPELEIASEARSRELLREGATQFEVGLTLQTVGFIGAVQLVFDALTRIVDQAGVGDVGVLSGSGGAEMAVIGDIWDASQGRKTVDEVVRSHGFHGPLEGELASHPWREDRTPLEKVVREYVNRDDPRAREGEAHARMVAMQREVAATFPRGQRAGVQRFLEFAGRRMPLRGVAKRSFLQGNDVVRGAARRLGDHLVERGALDDPEDVFHLMLHELTGPLPQDARELVAKRRARRDEYRALDIPGSWTGVPVPVTTEEPDTATVIEGIGASSGVVEGPARVVLDPTFVDVEPDEILIAPTTDPSWCSIMYVSSGLVVDMGGKMSHAAVVARELGLPCVVNTRTGTRRIRTGDHVRVDGNAGTVEILNPLTA